MVEDNATSPIGEEIQEKNARDHNIDILSTFGYITDRVAKVLHEHNTTLTELESQGRLFTSTPVTYFETVGITNEHQSNVSCDERRPDLKMSNPFQPDAAPITLEHTGYLFQHPVYKSGTNYLFRNEKSRRAMAVETSQLTPALIDIIFNLLDRGDQPLRIYDPPVSSNVDLEEAADSPQFMIFDDRIQFNDEGRSVNHKSSHRFVVQFEKGSTTFGYLNRVHAGSVSFQITQPKPDHFDAVSK